jgi:hypothetical protein
MRYRQRPTLSRNVLRAAHSAPAQVVSDLGRSAKMKFQYAISAVALSLLVGCTKEAPSRNTEGIDLHPDPHIIVKLSNSEYQETLTIPGDWDGTKYYNFTFNCPRSSVESLITFLYWTFELSSPSVSGSENLPVGMYSISFGDKKWDSKEDVIKDVMHAIEVAFDLDITLNESPRTLVVKKKK